MAAEMRSEAGFTLVELLLTSMLMLLILLAVLAAYSQGSTLAGIVQSDATIANSVRMTLQMLERDLRMIGFWVPEGVEIGASVSWQPSIFHATPTAVAFRADIDGGNALIICTPSTSNADCPTNRVLVDQLDHYLALNCDHPDDPNQDLPLVLIEPGEAWQSASCTAANTSDNSLSVAVGVSDDTFTPGSSRVVTVEQVYYRFIAGSRPPYGRLERYVRHGNTPDDSYPPASPSWETVAQHLTGFSFEYRDDTGAVLTGDPLTLAQREAVARIVISVEGIDTVGAVGPGGVERRIRTRTEVRLRNRM